MAYFEGEAHSAVREPFENNQNKHTLFSQEHEPSSDIWPALGDWILNNTIFKSWQRKDNQWMLRCVGAPGSGKTTLSALVMKKLKNECRAREAVASMFLRTDVVSSVADIVEDILCNVFHQLRVQHTEADADEASDLNYRDYVAAKNHGHRNSFRIQHLRDALYSRLGTLDRAFLVLDDFDRCDPAVYLSLENELSLLAANGLKVFLTSRIACLKGLFPAATCDSCPEGCPIVNVFWKCTTCKARDLEPHVLCQVCRDEAKPCANCDDSAHFVQPFDYIELNLDVNAEAVKQFVDWDLEREHGNLGLGSTNEEDLPPKSDLGRRLTTARNYETLEMLRENIQKQAERNVSLARLRLDNVHQNPTVDVILAPLKDALPANIVAFFNAGMQRIEKQPRVQRELGLQVIAAVTQYEYNSKYMGHKVVDGILRKAARGGARQQVNRSQSEPEMPTATAAEKQARLSSSYDPYYTLEEMVHAACGFLVVEDPTGDRLLRAYCQTFHAFAKENYNEGLMWARASLDFSNVIFDVNGAGGLAHSGVKRSHTAKKCLRPGLWYGEGLARFAPIAAVAAAPKRGSLTRKSTL